MKTLLIVDDRQEELDINLYDISFGKFEGYDCVILLQSKRQVSEEAVAAVPRPSSKGIASEIFDAVKLSAVVQGTDLQEYLRECREKEGVTNVVSVSADAEGNRVNICTKKHSVLDKDALRRAIEDLVKVEKSYAQEGTIYLLSEGCVVNFDDNQFGIEEKLLVKSDETAKSGSTV